MLPILLTPKLMMLPLLHSNLLLIGSSHVTALLVVSVVADANTMLDVVVILLLVSMLISSDCTINWIALVRVL